MSDYVNFTEDNLPLSENPGRSLSKHDRFRKLESAQIVMVPDNVFRSLEIDLVNNYNNDVALIRVLYKYKMEIEKFLNRTEKFHVDVVEKMKTLRKSITFEEQILGFIIVRDMQKEIKNLSEEVPVYDKELLLKPVGEDFRLVKTMIKHLAGQNFTPEIKIVLKKEEKHGGTK